MAEDSSWKSIAAQSRARQKRKLDRLLEKIRTETAEENLQRLGLGDAGSADDVRARLEAIVGADAWDEEANAVDQINTLEREARLLQAQMVADLDDVVEECENKAESKNLRKLSRQLLARQRKERTWVATAALVGLAVMIVAIELVLFREAGQVIARKAFPTWENVEWIANGFILFLVGAGAVSTFWFGRLYKEYDILSERRELAAEIDEKLARTAVGTLKAWQWQAALLIAVVAQVLLVFVRFAGESGTDTAQRITLLLSVVAAALVGLVALVEYHLHDLPIWEPRQYDEDKIMAFLANHQRCYGEIPVAMYELEQSRLRAQISGLQKIRSTVGLLKDPSLTSEANAVHTNMELALRNLAKPPAYEPPAMPPTKADIDEANKKWYWTHAGEDIDVRDRSEFDDLDEKPAGMDA